MQKKSKKIQKNVDIIRGVCYITYALDKKALKSLKKSVKKLKKVVDKTSRRCYSISTRCKKATQEMIFEN